MGDGGAIATAYVVIRPETKGFKPAAERELVSPMRGIGTRVAGAFAAGFIIRGAAKKLFVDPIKSAGDFQQSLNVLWATADHGKATLSQVSATAIKLGNDAKLPAVSAKDAADAMLELSKGGFSAKQSMAAARGTLLLATAAQIDNAQAAGILVDALHQYGLGAKEAANVTDLLAGAANRSTTGVPQIALALSQVGASAHALNIPIQDTVAAITQMANAGIKGSDAGTSLKTAFQRIIPTTKQAKEEVAKLGINVFDNNGKFLGLHNTIKQYHDALSKLNPKQRAMAINTIFGSDAARAANIIFGKSEKVFDANRKAIEKNGQAQKLANAQTKGFNGAMAGFSNVVDTLQLRLGLKLLPYMTRFVGFLTDIAGAKNLKVAIDVAIKGIKSAGADLSDMLFGSSKTITIGGEGRATRVVVDPGLIAGIQASIQATLATTDWSGIGHTLGAAISKSIVFTEAGFDKLANIGVAWANANSGKLANIGAVVGLKVVSKLLDPSFWLAHWQLIGGIALSVIPVGRFAAVGGKLAEVVFGRFGAQATGFILAGLAKLPEAVGAAGLRALLKVSEAFGTGGSRIVSGAIKLVGRVVDAFAGQFGRLGPLVKVLLNTAIVTEIASLGASAYNAAVKLAGRIVAGIKTAPSQLAGFAGDLWSKVRASVSQVAGQAYTAALAIGGKIVSGITDGIVDLPGKVGRKIAGGLGSAISWGYHHTGSTTDEHSAKMLGRPLVQGIIDGIQDSTLNATLKHTIAQSIREAITAGKRNLYSLTSSLAGDLSSIIDAATAKITKPLTDTLAQHQAARQLRDLTATAAAAKAALDAGPQSTTTDDSGNPVPLTPAEAAKQAAALNQAYTDAQQDLDDFRTQQAIDTANTIAETNKTASQRQIDLWTDQFNQGKISQQDFLADITGIINTYAGGEGVNAYQNMGDLLGGAFADAFTARLSDITAQIQQIIAGGQTEGGAALGQDAPQSAIDPAATRLADAQKDLTKQNAALASARSDIAALTAKFQKLQSDAQGSKSPGGSKITADEQARIDDANRRLTAAGTDFRQAQEQAARDKALIDALKPLVDAARAINIGTLTISDPAITAAILGAAR